MIVKKKNKILIIASLFVVLSGCVMYDEGDYPNQYSTPTNNTIICDSDFDDMGFNQGNDILIENDKYDQEGTIVLQNLDTRTLIYCDNNGSFSAESCAKIMESKGYVRLSDIPMIPAKYDKMITNGYPSRRWREGENVPRW